MNAERCSLLVVAGALLLAATAALMPLALPGVAPGWTLLDATLWGTTVLSGGTAAIRVVLTYVVGAGDRRGRARAARGVPRHGEGRPEVTSAHGSGWYTRSRS